MIEEEQDFFEEEEIAQPSVFSRIFRWIIVLAVLLGFVYLSGLDHYFFYQKTPPGAKQEKMVSAIDAQTLIVPLTIFILRNDGTNGSLRTELEVQTLVKKASKIWEQASVELSIKNIHVLLRTDEELEVLLDSSRLFFRGVEEFDASTMNVFLIARLRGINGLAFGGFRAIAIADYTSVYDFRALAHEVGHILGLDHIQNRQQLMYKGANGFELSLKEVLRARENAIRF